MEELDKIKKFIKDNCLYKKEMYQNNNIVEKKWKNDIDTVTTYCIKFSLPSFNLDFIEIHYVLRNMLNGLVNEEVCFYIEKKNVYVKEFDNYLNEEIIINIEKIDDLSIENINELTKKYYNIDITKTINVFDYEPNVNYNWLRIVRKELLEEISTMNKRIENITR